MIFRPVRTRSAFSSVISWPSEPNAQYQVQATPEIQPTQWTDVGAPLDGNGGLLKFVETNLSETPHRYFRILRQP